MNATEALREAERTIQRILIRLANDHGIEVESVEVDTRRFANLAVSIIPAERASTAPGPRP